MNTGKLFDDELDNLKDTASSLSDISRALLKVLVQGYLSREYDTINASFSDTETRNKMLKHFKNCIMEFVEKNLKEV